MMVNPYHSHSFYLDYLQNYQDKLICLHLHDNDGTDDQHLLPYDGTVNWNLVVDILKDCNYNGPITLELYYRKDYLKDNIKTFYKEGYERGQKIAKIY